MRRNTPTFRDESDRPRPTRRRGRREGSTWRQVALTLLVAVLLLGLAITMKSQLQALMSPISDNGSPEATRVASGAAGRANSGRGVENPGGAFGAAAEPGDDGEGAGQGAEAGQDGTGAESVDALAAGCPVSGRVTDYWGRAAPSVHVVLEELDGTRLDALTDTRGRFEFEPAGAQGARVTATLESQIDGGFAVKRGSDPISLTATVRADCEVNFDAWSDLDGMSIGPAGLDVGQWPSAVEIFENTRKATELASIVGVGDSDLYPFEVQAWCGADVPECAGWSDGAFFVEASRRSGPGNPMIAIVGSSSDLMKSGVPDNREYHEFGHLLQSVISGAELPYSPGDVNHGGYFGSPTSSDSMVEGFAEFMSMMASKYVDKDAYFEMYRIGAEYDLERDRLPWELDGWWEEFTVAGILLDFEDGGNDYALRGVPGAGQTVSDIRSEAQVGGTLVSGKLQNGSGVVVRDARVTVEFLDASGAVVGAQVARVLPERIAPGRAGDFYVVAPAGLEYASVTARPGGIARGDDDPVNVVLPDLVDVMFSFEREDGGRGVATVGDLYLAMSQAAGDSSAGFGGVTQEQVDEIFVRHGFFEDLNGDGAYDPALDGAIGRSSHFADEVGSEWVERWDPKDFKEATVRIDTGGLGEEAVIQISIPGDGGASGYSFTSSLQGEGSVVLPVPASGENAEMSVVTLGAGLKPSIAFRLNADEFHERLEAGTLEGVTVAAVQMADAQSSETKAAPGSRTSSDNAAWIMIGSAALLGLFVASVLFIFGRRRPPESL